MSRQYAQPLICEARIFSRCASFGSMLLSWMNFSRPSIARYAAGETDPKFKRVFMASSAMDRFHLSPVDSPPIRVARLLLRSGGDARSTSSVRRQHPVVLPVHVPVELPTVQLPLTKLPLTGCRRS